MRRPDDLRRTMVRALHLVSTSGRLLRFRTGWGQCKQSVGIVDRLTIDALVRRGLVRTVDYTRQPHGALGAARATAQGLARARRAKACDGATGHA